MRLLSLSIVLLFLLALQQVNPPVPSKHARVNKRDTKVCQQNSSTELQNNPPTVVSPNVETVNDQSKRADSYDPIKDALYRWYLIATIAGVAGAWVGILVIYRQTKAIRKSTELQEIALLQWIEISESWSIQRFDKHEGRPTIDITFALLNPTNYPLTLRSFTFDIGGTQSDLRLDRVLPPRKRHFFGSVLSLTPEQEKTLQTATLSLFVNGRIEFTSAMGKVVVQPLSGAVVYEGYKGRFVDRTRVPSTRE